MTSDSFTKTLFGPTKLEFLSSQSSTYIWQNGQYLLLSIVADKYILNL